MDKMKKITIVSDRELDCAEIQKIQWIMEESACPHESLHNSIEGYLGIGDDIVIGDRDG